MLYDAQNRMEHTQHSAACLELSTALFLAQPHPLSAYVFLWTEKPPDWRTVLANTLPHKGSKGVLLRSRSLHDNLSRLIYTKDMQYM